MSMMKFTAPFDGYGQVDGGYAIEDHDGRALTKHEVADLLNQLFAENHALRQRVRQIYRMLETEGDVDFIRWSLKLAEPWVLVPLDTPTHDALSVELPEFVDDGEDM